VRNDVPYQCFGTGAMKGKEIYEVWLAPDHRMPYCYDKGTFFIIAIYSDPCYIEILILILIIIKLIIILII
jgi:hypothetical protein